MPCPGSARSCHTPDTKSTGPNSASGSVSPMGIQDTPLRAGHSRSQTPGSHQSPAHVAFQHSSPYVKSSGGSHSSCGSHGSGRGIGLLKTPNSHTPGSGHKMTPRLLHTPNQPVYNPFETGLMDNLHNPVFSPNVFTQIRSAEHTPHSFRWTIDELAILKPVDIEENAHQGDALCNGTDPVLEERAQRAIDQYFQSHMVAPSPWTDSAKKPFVLPRTPKTPASFAGSPMLFSHHRMTDIGEERESVGSKEACCQTTLTLPPNFDLKKILGEHYKDLPDETQTEETSPDLSTSTLRRKLFFHGEEGSPPSPVKPYKPGKTKVASTDMDFDASPPVSPAKCQTPKPSRPYSPAASHTPSSGQFSSSPISSFSSSRLQTPSLRRCSTAPNMMDSPLFSPIPGSLGKAGSDVHSTPPVALPLQATPSSGQIERPFGSPGISPIRLGGGSYMETPDGKGASTESHSSRWSLKKIPVPQELQLLSSPIPHDDQAQDSSDMDVTSSGPSKARLACDINGMPVVMSVGDLSASGDSCEQDTALPTFLSNQDTGYQTSSLQSLMNSDATATASLHTNLTQQFGSLPLSGHETDIDWEEELNSADSALGSDFKQRSRDAAPWNPTLSKPDPETSHLYASSKTLDEKAILVRARQALGRAASPEDTPVMSKHGSDLVFRDNIGISNVTEDMSLAVSRGLPHGDKFLASQLAQSVIRRAHMDCDQLQTPELNMHHQVTRTAEGSVQDDELHGMYFYSRDSVLPSNQDDPKVSLSAEF